MILPFIVEIRVYTELTIVTIPFTRFPMFAHIGNSEIEMYAIEYADQCCKYQYSGSEVDDEIIHYAISSQPGQSSPIGM